MSNRAVLEVIALDAEDAVAAQTGGADRLELVTDIAADGLTPSRETFGRIRAAVDIPLRVMLRLTDGFTAGSPQDVENLVEAAAGLRAEGADEFVLGYLDASGNPDLVTVERILVEISGCAWTFHRAIDRATDREALRTRLADVPGLDTYLTAGSPTGVDAGLPTLLAEVARAGEPGYEAQILVGGGLRLDHVSVLLSAGIEGFHIGGAARPDGWTGPVSASAVREWRSVLDA
ncbi:copper homeostasis protein CutC [Streptomyces sp. NPDC056500]|uniref:copper homeostasis protein CutC n=1 Tax=Streptomyces sp. NPDC056500 TaxID=3345840 RepID=UPI0036AD3054